MATTAQQRLWFWGGLSLALHGLLLAGLSRSRIEPARGDPAPSFQIRLAPLPAPPAAPARPKARPHLTTAYPARTTPDPRNAHARKQVTKVASARPNARRTTAHARPEKPAPPAKRHTPLHGRPQPTPAIHPAAAGAPTPRHQGAQGSTHAPAAGGPDSPTKRPADTSAPARITGPLPHLYRLLHAAIERHKHYPLFARRLDQQGTARVAFRLNPDGAVQKVHIVASSGYRALDHAAIDAVTGIAPFDPARRYLEHHRNFEVNIVFQSY